MRDKKRECKSEQSNNESRDVGKKRRELLIDN
jgi:hypothetical protein